MMGSSVRFSSFPVLHDWYTLRAVATMSASDSVQLPGPSAVTLPAGTPIAQFANVDPNSGTNLCPDLVENQGHHFGAELSEEDKYALREFLKTR
jgi:hypothetical protein